MLSEGDLIINKIAQGKAPFESGVAWFDQLPREEQRQQIIQLAWYLQNTHPAADLVAVGLARAPIKATMTPVVLFKSHSFKIALKKVLALPVSEYRKSFITLLSLFQIADTSRRQSYCKGGCTHEWHNLIDEL